MLHDAKSAIIPLGRDTESHRNILKQVKRTIERSSASLAVARILNNCFVSWASFVNPLSINPMLSPSGSPVIQRLAINLRIIPLVVAPNLHAGAMQTNPATVPGQVLGQAFGQVLGQAFGTVALPRNSHSAPAYAITPAAVK